MTDRMTYADYTASRKAQSETNDCTVIATACVTGISYDEAHTLLKTAGRKKGRGVPRATYHTVIKRQGYTILRITEAIKSKTVRTIEQELAKKYGGCKVLVNIRHHVLAWDGYEIVDWSAGRIHRILDVYLVYPNDQPPTPKPVPVPERKKLRRTEASKTRHGVVVYCESLAIHGYSYPSVAAAYKALGFDLKGHQKQRKRIKTYGAYEFMVYHRADVMDWWKPHDVIMHTDDDKGREAFAKYYRQ